MNISDKNHPHHAVWREHVQSVLDGEPKVVQSRHDVNGYWEDFNMSEKGVCNASWLPEVEYRIKPRTIIRTITYPEPMKVAPKRDQKYWFISAAGFNGIDWTCWQNKKMDCEIFERGMCFATEADAKAAAQAIFGIES